MRTDASFFSAPVMEETTINDIIRSCLSIDTKACRVYSLFSESAKSQELKLFWKRMSLEEKKHIRFWKDLSVLAEQGLVPQVFDYPEQIYSQIKEIEAKAVEILAKCAGVSDAGTAFLMAYRLEFYALHPAFETLFQSVKMMDKSGFNPEDEYEEHINQFIEGMIKYGAVTPEIELLGETLRRLWRENKVLSRHSTVDDLTGVLNRRGFFNLVRPLGYLSQRNKCTVGILLIDIDHFKNINDRYGHQTGDRVLADVAFVLQDNLRTSDILGRYGGEEFIVFVTSFSPENLHAIAEKLRLKVETNRKSVNGVTISVGASHGRLEKDIEKEIVNLINRADKYLYDAKKAGRNRVVSESSCPKTRLKNDDA